METIAKSTRKSLILALTFSVLFVIGIPMIPLGAINKIWAVMIAGIVFVAAGFYGTPLLWIGFGNKCGLKRLVYAVEREHLYTVAELSEQLSKKPKEIRSMLDTCFNRRYLTGYRRAGDELVLNERKAQTDELHPVECPSCGAKFSFKGTDGACPYCRTPVKK